MPNTEPAASREGNAKGRATKQVIVERAVTAFAQKGFTGASLRGIAREAGVDHATLLHHFRTKTDLLLAVLSWRDEELIPPAAPAELSPEFVVDLLMSMARRNLESPGLVQLLSTMTAEAGAEGHPARAFLQHRHAQLTGVIAVALRLLVPEERRAASGLAPEQQAALLVATWEGLEMYDSLHPGKIDVPELLGHAARQAFGLPSPTAP